MTATADRALAGVISLLVLIQAALAGQSNRLFGTLDIQIHGMLGNTSFALAVIALGVAAAGKLGQTRIATLVALVLLMLAQTGLGYVGRETLSAAAWHIPLGVAIFGLSVYNLTSAKTKKAVASAS